MAKATTEGVLDLLRKLPYLQKLTINYCPGVNIEKISAYLEQKVVLDAGCVGVGVGVIFEHRVLKGM